MVRSLEKPTQIPTVGNKLTISLLRAVNVGGHKPVAMADLRAFLTQLGFEDVRSLLQSGNLLFRTASRPSGDLESLLEAEAEKRLALRTDFFVRTAPEWEALVRENPFPREAAEDPGHVVVFLLKDAPDRAKVEALRARVKGPELLDTKGRNAYFVYPAGIGRSKLTISVIERTLGTRGTGRNWNTVLKLAELSRA